ncbi:MAG: alpha/beta hydrolase [Bacteroidota bacterium]
MKKLLLGFSKVLAGIVVLLAIIYFLGPTPPTPQLDTSLPAMPSNLLELEKQIIVSEQSENNIKPDNEARIVWANPSQKAKTPYAVVYLHGFSASQGEGAPMHTEFAKRYGCNLYLARLYGHGIKVEDALLDWTAENFIASAKEAIAVGKQLGEKVIVMGTSTGCTAAIYLASQNDNMDALINYSPNINVADGNAWLLSKPWGLQIGRQVVGSDHRYYEPHPGTANMVTNHYRLEAVVALMNLLEHTMTEAVFQRVTQPFFMGYWYKNEAIQDDVVSVNAMLDMYDQLGTPNNLKRKVAFENATNHVLASPLWNDDYERVRQATFEFAEAILGMPPVPVAEENEVLEMDATQ